MIKSCCFFFSFVCFVPFERNGFNAIDTQFGFPFMNLLTSFSCRYKTTLLLFKLLSLFGLPRDGDEDVSVDG